MPRDPEAFAHLEWLGYVQPVGLVVSIPALLAAQAHINRNIVPDHARFIGCLPRDADDEPIPEIRDFGEFVERVLGWRSSDLERVVTGDSRYGALEVHLPEYQETLRPTFVVREFEPKDADHPWMMLIQSLPAGTALDKLNATEETHWQATPHAKFERLLRETRVPLGLLVSPSHLRLVYAPRGETSGYMTFSVAEMAQVAGRPMFAALHMLLSEERLFSLGEKQRLPAILADSRKYQNHVSNELAQQVLAALYELLRGFQAANDATNAQLLREVLAADPNHVYGGLLTVLLRLVFVLYAEDRDLISSDPVYANHYSITGLFERLRADNGRYPDTMDQRFGAWAQLLTLFRLIYDGGRHGGLKIPARRGYLFDPDRYNFLEGRPWQTSRRNCEQPAPIPRVPDGVIYRVLHNLLILDGERLSYRTLDVEQIGSVYETMMGFAVEVAAGRSIAIKPKKAHGAPATINLEALLGTKPNERSKLLKAKSDQDVTGRAATALKEAKTVEDLLAALDRKIARNVTPNVVARGSMVFQPSDERRKSGSHYTPRSLTEPIVRTTLRPILEQLGDRPTPEQILALNVCDPAMGSGAFLVETCRQLGDELIKAWHVHDCAPSLPPDEDEVLHARRLVAQQCLYGVDKNPLAVDLSKLSLWLATLAKDHPFTFLDHSLRCGDSLVGLSREQIAAFHWQPPAKRSKDDVWFGDPIAERMQAVTEYRQRILAARDVRPYEQLRQELDVADEALSFARLTGDLVIAAFFSSDNIRTRTAKLNAVARQLVTYVGPKGKIEDRRPLTAVVTELHGGPHPLQPFHWEIEFPEVFTFDAKGKPTGGFDAIVGNPPFAGKNTLINGNREGYLDWLKALHEESHGNADVVAHFFRKAFNLLRPHGCFGLIATNTIGQGDTRSTGLRWICTHDGTIYAARKRLKWPGQAAVMVSVVHVCRGDEQGRLLLDGSVVPTVTAYLFHAGGHDDPERLKANEGITFIGHFVCGPGFTFDGDGGDGGASPVSRVEELIRKNRRNSTRIHPYIGGEEVLNDPRHKHHRFVINFEELSEQEARQWPDLMAIVETKVKPERIALPPKNSWNRTIAAKWWLWGAYRKELREATTGRHQILFHPNLSANLAFAFLPATTIVGAPHNVLTLEGFEGFAVLQSRVHEAWARFFGSSLKDDLRYAPSDCFETFPFPPGVLEYLQGNSRTTDNDHLAALESAGREYYEFRAALMVRNDEGLTKTYKRFHDPNESSADIKKLRDLHASMDRAVLEAYEWNDVAETATCGFLLDYEDDEDDEEPTGRARTHRKPWRYRWPDDFRDEVLARLLDLNQKRAEEERHAGTTAAGVSSGPLRTVKNRKSRSDSSSNQTRLPGL